MAKRTIAGRVNLDWRRLLGFDQAMSAGNAGSTAQLSPKIGPKEARGFHAPNILGVKIGPKQAPDFGRCATQLGAKVGFKDN